MKYEAAEVKFSSYTHSPNLAFKAKITRDYLLIRRKNYESWMQGIVRDKEYG